MNGRQHYVAAEALLKSCQLAPLEDDSPEIYAPIGEGHEDGLDTCRNALMAADVHATLALAAATTEAAKSNERIARAIEKSTYAAAKRAPRRTGDV